MRSVSMRDRRVVVATLVVSLLLALLNGMRLLALVIFVAGFAALYSLARWGVES